MDLTDLYQEIILEHSRRPRNHGPCAGETHQAQAENPTCGDEVAVHLRLTPDHRVEAVTFTGQGCALSQASASLLTTKVRGKTLAEVRPMIQQVQAMMTGGQLTEAQMEALGDVQALAGAAQFPQRVKCVTLAWHALQQIVADSAAESRPAAG